MTYAHMTERELRLYLALAQAKHEERTINDIKAELTMRHTAGTADWAPRVRRAA